MNIQSMPSDVSRLDNPWLNYFIAARWHEVVIAQVLVKRTAGGFELRHVRDANTDIVALNAMRPAGARKIANFNSAGEYRPLKSTPDLPAGWLIRANSSQELEEALNHFYPNALADRFALSQKPPPITNYRAFTERQTGMYRITTFLSDADLARVIENLCTSKCLKQRLWSSGEIPTDAPEKKSAIPCLEPCAILLEAARKQVRAIQEKQREDNDPR
jgi:hypothetical protein